jgi:hypothetical protein
MHQRAALMCAQIAPPGSSFSVRTFPWWSPQNPGPPFRSPPPRRRSLRNRLTGVPHPGRARPFFVPFFSESSRPPRRGPLAARAPLFPIASSQSLLPRPTTAPSAGLVVSARGTTSASRFISVYRASAAWHRRLGPLDATAAAIAEGRLDMPKPRLTLRPSRRLDHASWERNELPKSPLGPSSPPGFGKAFSRWCPATAPCNYSSNP